MFYRNVARIFKMYDKAIPSETSNTYFVDDTTQTTVVLVGQNVVCHQSFIVLISLMYML